MSIKYPTRGMLRKIIGRLSSLYFPVRSFIITWESIPILIPVAILSVKIVNIIVIIAGTKSVISSMSIYFKLVIIRIPIKIRAGAVAAEGII